MSLGSIRDIYSQDTIKLEKQLKDIEAAKPGAFQSNYGEPINGLLDKIVNQKDFQYDFNADALYQQYKDNYTQLGKQASMEAAANVSALTGGFGNSYAATAATQANQQYMNQLNNVIPELYQLAMDKYQMDTNKTYNQLSAVGAQEDREYGRHRDTVNDWYTDRDYAFNRFNSSVGNDQYVAGYNQNEAQAVRSYSGGGASENESKSLQKVNTQYVNDEGEIVGVPGSGTSKMYNTIANTAINMSTTGNLQKAEEYILKQVNAGVITESEGYMILSRAEKTSTSKAPITIY